MQSEEKIVNKTLISCAMFVASLIGIVLLDSIEVGEDLIMYFGLFCVGSFLAMFFFAKKEVRAMGYAKLGEKYDGLNLQLLIWTANAFFIGIALFWYFHSSNPYDLPWYNYYFGSLPIITNIVIRVFIIIKVFLAPYPATESENA